jgi:hypothetical protein
MALEDYPFRVEELSLAGEFVRVLVYADHPIIARAAFNAAVEQYPKARIRLPTAPWSLVSIFRNETVSAYSCL